MFLVLVAGLVVVGAVAFFAIHALGGGSSGGGASSPDSAVTRFAAAVDSGDYLSALDLVAPDERQEWPEFIKQTTAKVKASGVTGGSLPPVSVQIEQQPSTPLAQDVAAVSIAGEVGVDLSSVSGEVGRLLGSRRQTHPRHDFILPGSGGAYAAPYSRQQAPPVHAIVIRQHGRWYVDPLLTGGDYLATRLNLPAGDYTGVDFHSGAGGSTPTEAVTKLFEAAAAEDPASAASLLAPAEERFLRVFGGSISEFLHRIDKSFDVSGIQVADASGEVVLHGAHIDMHGPSESLSISVQSNCAYWNWSFGGSSSHACILTDNALRSRVGVNDLNVYTVKVGGGYRVDLLRTLTSLITQFAGGVDTGAVRALTDELRFRLQAGSGQTLWGPVQQAAVGETLHGSYDGWQTRTFDLNVSAGRHIRFTPSTSEYLNVWTRSSSSGTWSYPTGQTGGGFTLTARTNEVVRVTLAERYPPECQAYNNGSAWSNLSVYLLSGCWWTAPGTNYNLTISS